MKDLYQIKEEYKKYVDLLIKYLKGNKLAFRRIVWLEYHGLNDYFDIDIEKNELTIKEKYKNLEINKPKDYIDIVIRNGNIVDKDKNNMDDNKDKSKLNCCCC